MTQRKIAYWIMPPEADAECVAHREEGLDHGVGHLAFISPRKVSDPPLIEVETTERPHHP
jgi:hypothetical protein